MEKKLQNFNSTVIIFLNEFYGLLSQAKLYSNMYRRQLNDILKTYNKQKQLLSLSLIKTINYFYIFYLFRSQFLINQSQSTVLIYLLFPMTGHFTNVPMIRPFFLPTYFEEFYLYNFF